MKGWGWGWGWGGLRKGRRRHNMIVIPAGDVNVQMIVGTEILNYQIINKRKHSAHKNYVYWPSLFDKLWKNCEIIHLVN